MFTGVRLKAKVKPFAKQIKGISHQHRLAIVYLLAHGPLEAREIVADVDLPQNLVEYHLKALSAAGWVDKQRVGRQVTYRLNQKAFVDLTKLLTDTPVALQFLSKLRRL